MTRSMMLAATLSLASPGVAQVRHDAGQRTFLQCQACHSMRAGEPHKIGPNLSRVYGARAATRPGYTYSAALRGAPLTWDEATLDRWLTRPSQVVPGTKMIFGGMASREQRRAVIDYLKRGGR